MYDNEGRLITAAINATEELDEMTFASAGVVLVKVYVWKDLTSMEPISMPEELVIASAN